MLTDKSSHFGGALSIAALDSNVKNFTEDLVISGVAATAVDARNHLLNADGGMPSEPRIKVFTEDGITGVATKISVEVLTDDDPAFGSARTVLVTEAVTIGTAYPAGTDLFTIKLPEGLEKNIRLRVRESGTGAVGAGSTISARYFMG